MTKNFSHEFSASNGVSFEPESPARIHLDIGEDGFWFSANREGWLHIARLAAELGMGNHENGFHFHANEDFGWSDGPPEFTFELNDELT